MSSTLTEQTQTTVERWTADPSRTTVEFEVKHLWGLHTVRGRFNRFDGSYVDGPTGGDRADDRRRERRHGQRCTRQAPSVVGLLQVALHPQVRFTSTHVTGMGNGHVHVSGELEAAGTRVPLAFDASVRMIDGELELERRPPSTSAGSA